MLRLFTFSDSGDIVMFITLLCTLFFYCIFIQSHGHHTVMHPLPPMISGKSMENKLRKRMSWTPTPSEDLVPTTPLSMVRDTSSMMTIPFSALDVITPEGQQSLGSQNENERLLAASSHKKSKKKKKKSKGQGSIIECLSCMGSSQKDVKYANGSAQWSNTREDYRQ